MQLGTEPISRQYFLFSEAVIFISCVISHSDYFPVKKKKKVSVCSFLPDMYSWNMYLYVVAIFKIKHVLVF